MANEYLQRTLTSSGNGRVFTWSGWVKKQQNAYEIISFSSPNTANDGLVMFGWNPGTGLYLNFYQSSISRVYEVSEEFGDFGSWLHYQIAVDTTQITDGDRVNFYINGIQRTLTIVSGYSAIPQNYLCDNMIAGNETLLGVGRNSLGNFSGYTKLELSDIFFVDGQALTPDVFGFYKEGKGYISAGSTQATDFRPGQWVPKTPRVIKTEINRRGGFGVNGFYLPMNDSKNFGADFHCDPNSIIKLNEELPQPRVGVATTASVGLGYTDALRTDPYAANLVLAIPGVSGGQGSGYGDYSANIKGSGSNKTITAYGNAGIAVTASYYGSALSFDGTGDYLTVPASSDLNFGTGDFTAEFWLWSNPSNSSDYRRWLTTTNTNFGSGTWVIRENAGDKAIGISGGTIGQSNSFQRGQWNHIAYVRYNTTESVYVNGVAVGISTNSTYNYTEGETNGLYIGGFYLTGEYFDGYMQDLRIYKGVAKYKGGFDVPKPYTPVGIATWRAVSDTTANNFATWNPISPASDTTFTNGNLTVAYGSSSTIGVTVATVGIAATGSGKYYWENRIDTASQSPTPAMIGVWGMSTSTSAASHPGNTNTYGWSYYGFSGNLYYASGSTSNNVSYGASFSAGDIIGVALDMTTSNGTITFYKNGVSQGVATTGIGTFLTNGNIHAIMPALGDGGSVATYTASTNFGQNPTFSGNVSIGTFTDSNGKGLFKYQPPSGFLALCEDNLPTPAISNPGQHFKTVLWTGDGNSGRSIVGVGFTPDLVWIKERTNTSSHALFDSVRGAGKRLFSDLTNAEQNGFEINYNPGFNSDGFSVGDDGAINQSNENYVAWCWRAGAGTTSTNTNGSIPSVVSVNQTAGFSIVSYTGTGSAGTVGHGLGKAPSFIIVQTRQGTNNRDKPVYHISTGTNYATVLNSTSAGFVNSAFWNNTAPTSNVFSVGTDQNSNQSTSTYIAYCWAEIEGFSKFGSYVGNGNADGPFIYTGGRPAFVMVKRSDGVTDWHMFDSSRYTTNPNPAFLYTNLSSIEAIGGSTDYVDFLSNGFKWRSNAGGFNASGGTYIFACFMESPFTTANSK